MAAYVFGMRFLGTDDTVNTCECCGRTDLKSTVAIETDGGDILHYGTTCAARALKTTAKIVKSETAKADEANRKAIQAERDRANQEAYAVFQAWLDAKVPSLRSERFLQIEKLGGFRTANELFQSETAT